MVVDEKRCNKCIIPNTCTMIPFDSNGTCGLCSSVQKGREKNTPSYDEKKVTDFIEQVKQRARGKSYDCVVGVSGGRDSTYLLYLLTQKHHLRCLAVYYRTPFTSDTIDRNIRRIVKQMGADFEEIQLSNEYHRDIARKMVLLWKKHPHRLIINMACAPCKILNREMYKITQKHGIPTIIYGANIYEAVQIAGGTSQEQVLAGQSAQVFDFTNKIKKLFAMTWKGIKLLGVAPSLFQYFILGIKSSIMYICPHTLYLALRYPGIKAYDYFFDGKWDEQHVTKILKELGWERPPGCNASWKADCCFAEIKNILFQKTVGITYADAFFSNMVRAGVLTREEALNRVRTEGRLSMDRLKETQKILDLDDDFFNGIL